MGHCKDSLGAAPNGGLRQQFRQRVMLGVSRSTGAIEEIP